MIHLPLIFYSIWFWVAGEPWFAGESLFATNQNQSESKWIKSKWIKNQMNFESKWIKIKNTMIRPRESKIKKKIWFTLQIKMNRFGPSRDDQPNQNTIFQKLYLKLFEQNKKYFRFSYEKITIIKIGLSQLESIR